MVDKVKRTMKDRVRGMWGKVVAPWRALKLLKTFPMFATFRFGQAARLVSMKLVRKDPDGSTISRMLIPIKTDGKEGDGIMLSLAMVAHVESVPVDGEKPESGDVRYDVAMIPAVMVKMLAQRITDIVGGKWGPTPTGG